MPKGTAVVNVGLIGTSPIMFMPMTGATLDGLIHGVRETVNKDAEYEKVCANRLYFAEDEKTIVIPSLNVMACLKAAGRKVKNGRYAISTAESTTLFGMLKIPGPFDEVIPLTNIEDGWIVDKRRGVLKNAGKSVAVGILRPKFKKWGLDFTIEIDLDEVAENTIRELFRIAGKFIGLCEFRPQKGGPFGCFEVSKWELVRTIPREALVPDEAVVAGTGDDAEGDESAESAGK